MGSGFDQLAPHIGTQRRRDNAQGLSHKLQTIPSVVEFLSIGLVGYHPSFPRKQESGRCYAKPQERLKLVGDIFDKDCVGRDRQYPCACRGDSLLHNHREARLVPNCTVYKRKEALCVRNPGECRCQTFVEA